MTLRTTLLFSLTLLCAFSASAQTRRIYVRDGATTGGSNTSTCTGLNGTSAGLPLRSDSAEPMDGLAQAIRCANNYTGSDNLEIIVLCSISTAVASQNYCTYINDAVGSVGEFTLTKPAPTGKRFSIRGEPARMVRVAPNAANAKPFRLQASRWTVEGLTFDGDWNYRGGAFISITGSDVRFQQNTVMNSRGKCIDIAPASPDGTAPPGDIANVWISNNTIAGCYDHRADANGVWGFEDKDVHCIHNTHADNLTVENNDISDCQGDGFQTEMYLPKRETRDCDPGINNNLQALGGFQECIRSSPHYATDVALNTKIVGNRFWTTCRAFKTGAAGTLKNWTIGEDAIDIKRTGAGLRIANNRIWGRRSFPKDSSLFFECRGTGSAGSGSGASGGGGIVLHGNIEGTCVSPDVTPGNETDESMECAVIEGNEIFDNQGGISLGEQADTATQNNTIGTGRPRGVAVRGNYIHDLRGNGLQVRMLPGPGGVYPNTAEVASPQSRGRAFNLSTGQDIARDYWNRVYRNTLANIPGHPFDFGSSARRFKAVNNIISHTGGPYISAEVDPGQQNARCKIALPTIAESYVINEPDNFWFKSLKPGGGLTALNTPPGFLQLWGWAGLNPQSAPTQAQQPFDGTTNCGASPLAFIDNSTGNVVYRDTVSAISSFADFRNEYDYRLNNTDASWTVATDPPGHSDSSTPPLYSSSTSPLYSRRHRDHGENCGTKPEFGADEQCDRSRVFVREVKESTVNSRDDEIYAGAREYLWQSPDLGVGVGSHQTSWVIADPADGDLPSEPAIVEGDMTPQPTRLFVRIRTTSAAGAIEKLVAGDKVRVKIHGGPAHVDWRFPTTAEPLVDREITWRAAGCTSSCNDASGGWNWHGGTASVQVFSFPWTPRGARVTQGTSDEHYCLLAEVSAERDRSPPTFTSVLRSNNLAQRNVMVTRFPAEIGKVGFFVEGEMNSDGGNPGSGLRYDDPVLKRIDVVTGFNAARPAYLFFPSVPAFDYVNDGTTTFPPEGKGQIYSLQPGLNKLNVDMPNLGRRYAEILIDNRGLPVPDETEYVQLASETGGLMHYLNAPNLIGESFELLQASGLPSGWEKSGIWRTVDQYSAPTCGASAFGRKGAATNNATCTYDTGARVTGLLESPTVYWTANSMLDFKNWSETERYLDYDVRRVTIKIMEGILPAREVELARWSGADAGSRDNWVRERISLAPHWVPNSTIKIRFHFDTMDSLYNNYAGWYVDDVEVK